MNRKKLIRFLENVFYDVVQITKDEYYLYLCESDLKDGLSARIIFKERDEGFEAVLMPKETLETIVEELKGEGIYNNARIKKLAMQQFEETCKKAYIGCVMKLKKHRFNSIKLFYQVRFRDNQAS